MPRPKLTAREQKARAVQLENDAAALLLVRQAALLEVAGLKAGRAGKLGHARAKLEKATAYRAAAARLVLTRRPASLGVPRWLGQGVAVKTTPSDVMAPATGTSVGRMDH